MQFGRQGQAQTQGVSAMVVECGQHFKQASADLATDVALGFLAHFGLVAKPSNPPPRASAQRLELLHTHVIQTTDFATVRPLVGFEVFAKGELIATDGALEVRAPCDDCTIMMPARSAIIGREGMYLTRPI
jgi:predicted deacylase